MSLIQDDVADSTLVELAIAGDTDAFGELYSRHLDAIYRYIYFRIGDVHDAEDLTEMTFLRAWESLPSYKSQGSPFTSWLYRIAHNLTVDYYRRNKTHQSFAQVDREALLDQEQAGLMQKLIANEEVQELAKALSRLTEEQQQVIILRFIQGLDHTEVARHLNKTDGACRMLQYRALTALNQILSHQAE